MLTLALDTALDRAAAALVADGRIVGAAGAPSEGNAEAVDDHVRAALAEAGARFADVSAVTVTVGPGSFTGVRVGVAYAKGVAFARGLRAGGVTTLAALAATVEGPALAVVDARHGAVFAGLSVAEGPSAARMSVAEARALAEAHGARVVGPASAIAAMALGDVAGIDLATVARLGVRGDALAPVPLYLAAVDAAPQRHKALARA